MEKKIENAIIYGVIAALIICMLGVAALPAVLASRYGWGWMLVYPAVLILSFATRKRK